MLFRITKFTYKPEERLIFTVPRNMQVPSMKWITMMGSSGSGKTSLCNLFLRRANATCDAYAHIAFLGEYSKYSFDEIRQHVSNIRPNLDIFDQSIYFNLTFGVHLKPALLKKRLHIPGEL